MKKPNTFIYKTIKEQNVEIPLDIYFPDNLSIKSPPKPLIWIHTGGFLQGTKTFFPFHFLNACNKLNLALIKPDYRLAPQVKIQEILKDIQDSIRFTLSVNDENSLNSQLIKNDLPKLDLSQYILAGSSAGGWASLLQGLGFMNDEQQDIPSPLAVISIYPITTISQNRAPYFYKPLKPLPWPYNLQAKVGDEVPIEPLKPHLDPNSKVLTEAPPLILTSRAPLYSFARQEGIFPELVLEKGQKPDQFCLPSLIESGIKPSNTKLVFIAYGDTDPMVEIDQSQQVIKALQSSSNLSFEVATYVEPGKGHLWDILDTEADIPILWEKVEKLLSSSSSE